MDISQLIWLKHADNKNVSCEIQISGSDNDGV